jgi:hypothetical protein
LNWNQISQATRAAEVASAAGLYVLPSRVNSSSEGAQGLAVCDVDPLDIVAAIREGLLVRDSDLMVGLVRRCFGDAFTEDTPCEKEGLQ